jgi:hypothetical protein
MKVAAIKFLVNTYTIDELRTAEEALCTEESLSIEVEGAEDAEKLTHILAAIEILKDMANGNDYTTALRNYFFRVRNSIN